MSTKNLVIALVAALAVFGLVVYFFPHVTTTTLLDDRDDTFTPELKYEDFTSLELGLNFKYLPKYFLQERDLGTAARAHTALILTEIAEEEVKNGEGPVSITIDVYQNDFAHDTPESWIRNNSDSNFKLSDGILRPFSVGGEPALVYRWSGLYEGDSVVVVHGRHLYSFTVTHLTHEDEIGTDFNDLLSTVSFTQ